MSSDDPLSETSADTQRLARQEATRRLEQVGAAYSEHVDQLVEQLISDRNQTSDLVRYIGFGLIGFFFFLANASEGLAYRLARDNSTPLLAAGLLGCLTIAFDYLNLLFRGQARANLLDLIDLNSPQLRKSADSKYYLYDPDDRFYRLSGRFFLAKQVTAALGSLIVIFVFAKAIFWSAA